MDQQVLRQYTAQVANTAKSSFHSFDHKMQTLSTFVLALLCKVCIYSKTEPLSLKETNRAHLLVSGCCGNLAIVPVLIPTGRP